MRPLLLLAIAAPAFAQISAEQLRSAQSDAGMWLNHGRNTSAWRYSELDEVNASTVARLTPQWIFQTGAGRLETTPLVFDGRMFLTGDANRAYALDLLTGRPLWRYAKPVPEGAIGCCGTVNRGFATLGDRLFKVNFDATLVALDVKTGKMIWETQVADYKKGFSLTVAPLIAGGLVIIGNAGAEFGTRGFIDAYDPATGKRVWRFWTVAAPGEPGGNTWPAEDSKYKDAWKRGGGSAWVTGSYDPDLDLIYWGTGNPGPDMNGDVRPGDNLYTCSVVALEASTGKLRWHYQFTPHDVHDWDSTEDMVLADITAGGQRVKGLLHADRNGFYYLLDRTNGKVLAAKPYTKVTWAKEIGADGRPVLVPGQDPTDTGNESCPGLGGGHNWPPTSYSPQTGLYYFGSTDGCQMYFKTEYQYVEGQWYQLSTTEAIPKRETVGSLVAVNAATGETAFRIEMPHAPNGMLSTAGGLVFTGDSDGYLMAFDAKTGKNLWRFQTGASISAAPITYRFRGKQVIAIAAGSNVMTFALPEAR